MSLKDNKKDAFMGLEQVSMFIVAYEANSMFYLDKLPN